MTTSVNRASGSGSLSGSSRGSLSLQRGRACRNCRYKCDGQRPVCSQCLKSARPGDACEYIDEGRTHTQVLEEKISRLEARIRELEEPFDENSVKLHSPYTQSQGRSSSMPTLVASSSEGIMVSTSATPSPLPSSVSHSDTAIQEEPPANVVHLLLQSFLPHAIEFGFFLNISRFQESALRPLPLGHHARPAPALLSAVYLLGLHLSGSTGTKISVQESSFLSRALLHVANILSSSHPHRIIHGIQSEILLSTYCFRKGRILEGKYHLTVATSLTLGAGFHHIRSQTTSVSLSLNLQSGATPFLPAPSDQIEEGERINAFWTTFALCNTWKVAIGSPLSSVVFESHGSRIDTPWPLDMHEYEQVGFSCTWQTLFGRFSYCMVPQERLSPDLTSSSTVQNFLNQRPSTSSEYSTMAMYVKSSILLEKAGTVAALYKPGMQVEEANRFAGAFASLDRFIDTFHSTLAPIEQTHISSPLFGTVLLTHTITHAATIHLHEPFVNENPRSQSKSLSAAEACVNLLRQIDINSLTQVNPLFGSLWTGVCKVLINEIQHKRALRAGWAGGVPVDNRQQENELAEKLEKVFTTMAVFSLDSPLMSE
ncbi:hypothetical protein K435DRAFT_684747 [Dendrothele bispora CBS 962.96]|uniref:Zn(2)-C6 fungal-type domain-containing protein n=1 Tax=Dendrothele bispora (strain CBS 962.96) TaxID=1314807 RepID=A0A4S8LAM0_DENBC|nr:hypothetical protein K435DRAFT_684747 [Dendrothele bispora CBS 962.96]